MSYVGRFERAFMHHTLEIVRNYEGPYDATLLLNCLLGLLIVPKETCFNAIPEDPISELPKWGISVSSIQRYGNRENAKTLRGLVHSLRNSVAHSRFDPIPAKRDVTAFHFTIETDLTLLSILARCGYLSRGCLNTYTTANQHVQKSAVQQTMLCYAADAGLGADSLAEALQLRETIGDEAAPTDSSCDIAARGSPIDGAPFGSRGTSSHGGVARKDAALDREITLLLTCPSLL